MIILICKQVTNTYYKLIKKGSLASENYENNEFTNIYFLTF